MAPFLSFFFSCDHAGGGESIEKRGILPHEQCHRIRRNGHAGFGINHMGIGRFAHANHLLVNARGGSIDIMEGEIIFLGGFGIAKAHAIGFAAFGFAKG